VAFAGTVRTGGVVSFTVTVNKAEPALLCVSVAVHVTVVVPSGKVEPLDGVQLTGRAPSTLSVADAEYAKTAPADPVASTVTSPGTVSVGGVLSVTVTVNEVEPALPCVSVAVQATVVVPSGNVEPLGGAQVTGTTPSVLSMADALYMNTAPAAPIASTVAFAGTATTGAVLSVTVNVNEAEPMLPRASIAVHVIVVVPSGNVEPLDGVQLTGRAPSTLSVADAEYVKIAPAGSVASTVAFAGTVRIGGAVSPTVTVNEAEPVLSCVSVAVHVTVVVPKGNVEPLAGVQLTTSTPSMVSVAEAV
jgi:hypothetical protein